MSDGCAFWESDELMGSSAASAGSPTSRCLRSPARPPCRGTKARAMTIPKGVGIGAATVLLLVAITACSGKGKPLEPPSRTPAPSASATTASPSAGAASAASAVVRSYYATLDQVRQQPATPLDALSTVAISVELSSLKTLVGSERTKGERQTGSTSIEKLEVESVNLDNSDPAAGKVPAVQIDVCWNVARVDIIDAAGQSVVSSGRRTVGWTRLTVANYRYPADPTSGWRVATSQDLARPPCAGS